MIRDFDIIIGDWQLVQYAEDEPDVRKIYHEATNHDSNVTVMIGWTPYQWMTHSDFALYLKLGRPNRPGGGNWDHESLADYGRFWSKVKRLFRRCQNESH